MTFSLCKTKKFPEGFFTQVAQKTRLIVRTNPLPIKETQMFEKHSFTCPDVIYLIDKQKKRNRLTLVVSLVSSIGLIVTGKMLEARDAKLYPEPIETPDNQE